MYAWQATVQDEAGNIVPLPVVTVYLNNGTTLASIFNEAGAPLPNPLTGTMEGFVQFWANAGQYKIRGAKSGNATEMWAITIDAPAIRAEEAADRAEDAADLAVSTLATAGSRFRTNEPWAANIPWYNVSAGDIAPPKVHAFFRQDTAIRNDANTVFIQRVVNTDDGLANPKALRAVTIVNVDTAQTEWAISGEVQNYSNTVSTGCTAVSGVSNKYGRANAFGGHFQSNDYNIFETASVVSPIVGAEMNIQAVGLDHPTANQGYGNRRVLDILPRTLKPSGWDGPTGNTGEAEVGSGVTIRTDNITNGGFRYGLSVYETASGGGKMSAAGIQVSTSGARGVSVVGPNTGGQVYLGGAAANGLIVNGTYSGSAVRIATGQKLSLSSNDLIGFRYTSDNVVEVVSGDTQRIGLVATLNPEVRMNGVKVVGAQRPAIANATSGTEVARINDILAALRAHGLIAT